MKIIIAPDVCLPSRARRGSWSARFAKTNFVWYSTSAEYKYPFAPTSSSIRTGFKLDWKMRIGKCENPFICNLITKPMNIFFAAEAPVLSLAVDENYNLIEESFSICNNHQTSELRGKFNVQNYFSSCCFASHARWWQKSIKVFFLFFTRLDPQLWADISCDPPLMSAAKRMVFVWRLNLRANRTLCEASLFTCYTPRNYWLELEENAGKAPLGFSSSPFWFFRFSQNSFAWHWLTNTTIFQACLNQ